MLKQRIADASILRLIKRFLISGYVEEDAFHETDKGTPQGGVISPMLANIYLHYVLDLWFTKVARKRCHGYVEIIRYADDFVICVQNRNEANAMLMMLKERLEKFGLELVEDKTRIVEFGRFAAERMKRMGRGKPGTFNFLGFTHYCTRSREGKFRVGRITDRKKLRTKLKGMSQWLKGSRNAVTVEEWWKVLCAKLQGHLRYYGVSENSRGISMFFYVVRRMVFKWINRRNQRRSMNWEQFSVYCRRHNLPEPKIYVSLHAAPFVSEGIGT